MYVGRRAGNKPWPAEKAAITAACERLIAEVLQPRGSVKNLGHYAASWSAWWPKRPSSTAALT